MGNGSPKSSICKTELGSCMQTKSVNRTPRNLKQSGLMLLQKNSFRNSDHKSQTSEAIRNIGSCIDLMYADLSLSNASKADKIAVPDHIGGYGILANLGGEILSQFRYETSMNQSKLLITGSHLSSLSS